MATGIVKTFTDSASAYVSSWGITVKLNFQLTMTQTYIDGSGKSNLTFSDFKMSYSGGNIGTWTGLVDGIITVTVNGTTYTIYNEIWSSSYINKYNCAMAQDTYNTVKLVDDDTPWTYTLSDLPHNDDGSLSVNVAWEKITNVTNIRGYGIYVAGEETTALTENLAMSTYELTITQDQGSTIAVNRTSSPKGNGSLGQLYNGESIYTDDVLEITFLAQTGYNLDSCTVNGTAFTSGDTWTVNENVAVRSTSAVKSFVLTISAGAGSAITVTRLSSPKQGAATGTLSNQSTIYYGDIIKSSVSINSEGYNLLSQTLNGLTFTNDSTYEVVNDVIIKTTTEIQSVPLDLSKIDSGIVICTVERTNSPLQNAPLGNVNNGELLYYMDEVTINLSPVNEDYLLAGCTVNGSPTQNNTTYTIEAIELEYPSFEIIAVAIQNLWTRKRAYINNKPYIPYIFRDGAFTRFKIYIYELAKLKQYGNFYTVDGEQFYTVNGEIFNVVMGDYTVSEENAVIGIAYVGKAIVGQGG